MRFFVMFVTAICVLFLIKLRNMLRERFRDLEPQNCDMHVWRLLEAWYCQLQFTVQEYLWFSAKSFHPKIRNNIA